MTSFLPGRRRAEQFAQAVEGTRTTDPRVTQLLEVVDRVRRPAPIEPSAQFSAELRERLLAEAAAIRDGQAESAGHTDAATAAGPQPGELSAAGGAGSGSGNQRPSGPGHRAAGSRRRPTRPRNRVLVATTAITLVAGMFGIVSFARDAMPGETLYGLKRSLEETQAVIATNSESRGRQYLASGRARLSELESLINQDRPSRPVEDTEQPQDRNRTRPTNDQQESTDQTDDSAEPRNQIDPNRVALARKTLQDFADQTEQGGDLLLEAYENEHHRASLEQLQAFTEESGRELADLAPDLPEELGDSFTEATRVLHNLDERIGGFCADCVSLIPEPEPSPTPSKDRSNTPSPTPSTPSPTPSRSDDPEEPSPEPTDTVSPRPENPSPSPRLPDDGEDEDTDDPLPLPTELPLPLF